MSVVNGAGENLDKVVLVDSNDQPIGEMDKYEAHKYPAKLHRASSVWLVNSAGQALLQKRSSKKIVGAEWWGNAICGNVRPTESYEECAVRRLKEEIGVENADLKLKPIYKFSYQAYGNQEYGEHEVDQVYLGKYDGEVVINEDEVSEIAWVDLDSLVEQVSANPTIPDPEETLGMSLEELRKKTAPCEVEIGGTKQFLAPWTCMMLQDEKLIKLL